MKSINKISVCIATYNGEKYIVEQIESILTQLPDDGEIIISDDCSTDDTLNLINSFNDKRISIYKNESRNLIKNFENAIKHARGEIIFLADQDDIWALDKVKKMLEIFDKGFDIVVSDCEIINAEYKVVVPSYFKAIDSGSGFIRNLVKRNSYMGCCMAFRTTVKEMALPFPEKIPMHDLWIGMLGEINYKPYFLDEKLVMYRQHENNASDTSLGISKYSLWQKIEFRIIILYYLLGRFFKYKFYNN